MANVAERNQRLTLTPAILKWESTVNESNVTNVVVTAVCGGAVLKRERGAGAGPELGTMVGVLACPLSTARWSMRGRSVTNLCAGAGGGRRTPAPHHSASGVRRLLIAGST
eukprot:scaffold35392_cov68-Phaeocystis_antarctica.AAC.1